MNGTHSKAMAMNGVGAGEAATNNPVQILMRRRWQLFACLLLVCVMALASAFLARPTYQATSQVRVVGDSPDKMGGLAELLGGGRTDYFDTQCKLIKSRKVLGEASRRIKSTPEWICDDVAYENLKSKIQVTPVSQSRLIEINGLGETPSEAAALANHVTAAFVDTVIDDHKAGLDDVIRRIDGHLDAYARQIAAQEQKLAAFCQDHKIVGSGGLTRDLETQISAWEKDLAALRLERLELNRRTAEIKVLLGKPAALEAGDYYVKELADNPTLAGLEGELRTLSQEETQLARIYLPGHDRLKAVRQQIADLKNVRYRETVTQLNDLSRQMTERQESDASREQTLSQLLAEQRDKSLKLAGYQGEYDKMTRQLAELVAAHDKMIQTRRNIDLSASMEEVPVVVVDMAQPPSHPVGLTTEHRAASILLLGLVFSVVFVLSVDRLTTNQIQDRQAAAPAMAPWGGGWVWPSLTNPPVSAGEEQALLGRIDQIDTVGGSGDKAVASRCRIVQFDAASGASNAFRAIGARLLSRFGRSHQSLVLTGGGAGGKTTCACNLALTIAQARRRVVLVDFQPLTSPVALAFQYTRNLLDLQSFYDDRSMIETAICETDVPGLSVVSVDVRTIEAGTGAAALALLQAELLSRFDWVIHDSGSIGDPVADRMLQVVGKALLVSGAADCDGPEMIREQVENRGAVSVGYIDNRYYRIVSNPYRVRV